MIRLADETLTSLLLFHPIMRHTHTHLQDLLKFNLLSWPGRIRAGLGALGFIRWAPKVRGCTVCVSLCVCHYL